MYLLDKYLEKNLSFDAINQPTRSRRTPFREAAAHGMLSVVERLLQFPDHKDIVNVADTRIGRNALHCAALRGHFKVVQLLLENGADINLKDGPKEEGLTALELCHNQWANNRTRKYEDIVLLLIDRNPPVAAQDVQLLVAATINNSRKVLEKLHAVGADLTQPDRYGWTPIILATRFHQDDARKYLEQQLKQVGNRPSSFEVDSEEIQLTKGGTILTASKPCDSIY
jgi:ankyrin repeat protein